MIVAPYNLEKYGFILDAAAIEIEELTSRKDPSFKNENNPTMPCDGFIRISIWVNKEAHDTGKEPIYVEEKAILLDYQARQAYHQSVLENILEIDQ